jgi:Type III restriction enzyme, res subunit/Helicase C-terminal domain
MSLFRTSAPAVSRPESPVLLFRDLRRDASVKFLWGHQEKTLDAYFRDYRKASDIAIELPTGTGKTLVGLLIAEYRRRAMDERVAFLCSTRQLCAQVSRLAQRYGIPTSLLVGSQANYDPKKFANYQQGKAIAVTTYSGIFNSNPKISDPHVIVCDDAHSADSFVSDMWTVRVSRYENEAGFVSLMNFLKATIPENLLHRIQYFEANALTRTSVDLISTVSLYEKLKDFRDAMEAVVEGTDLIYSWSLLSPHLSACSLYCSPDTLELRPILAPTRTHRPFANARQRIYMSATLGDDGDIERSFGVKEIQKLPVPEGWDRHGTGRRLFLFPGITSLETQAEAIQKLLQVGGKNLILVRDNRTRDEFAKNLKSGFQIFISADTEQEIQKFRSASAPAVLILANRYDGIDFPGDDCRNMLVYSLPTGANLQEAYMVHRLNAVAQLRDRIRTRITQAVGRCTRDESDYSVVIVDGNDLLKWFCTKENTAGMHPELQAEIAFGLDNSEDRSASDLLELSKALLQQTPDWEVAEADLKNRRDSIAKQNDPCAATLAKAAPDEIEYIYNLWAGNYVGAYKRADDVVSLISGGEDIRPYRTFWEHQAAVAAFLAWKHGLGEEYKQTAVRRLESAAKNQIAINWLGDLISKLSGGFPSLNESLPIQEWFNQINWVLGELGLKGKKYHKRMVELRRFISSTNADQFHQGLEWLGQLLGAESKQWKTSGTPDGMWQFGMWFAAVFEAKTDEFSAASIALKTVRQASTHEHTAKHDKSLPKTVSTATVVISPRNTIAKDALPHAAEMRLVSHSEIIDLFDKAAASFEEVRLLAPDMSEHELRGKAVEVYKKNGVYMSQVRDFLLRTRLDAIPSGA